MGGNLFVGASRTRLRFVGIAALVTFAAVAAGCDSEATLEPGIVNPADAYTAIVDWQVGEQPPVVDDNGTVRLPVIFIVANAGDEIGIGIQAEVTAATNDMATVRFADKLADAFASAVDGEPVREEGTLLLISPMPEPAAMVTVDLVRYETFDDAQAFELDVTAVDSTPDITDGPDAPHAVVTAVRRP